MLKEKLDDLKGKVNDANLGDKERLEWERYFRDIEKDISKMERYRDFLDHAVSKQVIHSLLSWVREANVLLLSQKSAEGSERLKAIVRRDTLLDVLSLFSPSKTKDSSREQSVDGMIKDFEDYYGKA